MVLGAIMLAGRLRGAHGSGRDHGHDHHHHGHEGWAAFAVGLVPCSGAVVVLAYALANDILLAGLGVVAAIGVGMAATMSGLGLVCVLSRRAITNLGTKKGRLLRSLEVVGPTMMILVGLGLLATLA